MRKKGFLAALVIVCGIVLLFSCTQDEAKPTKCKLALEKRKVLMETGDTVSGRLGKIGYARLTDAEKTFLCAWSLQREVNTGGFKRFYSKPAGDYAAETVGAFERIGANYTADIIKRANNLFKNGEPSKYMVKRRGELNRLTVDARQKLLKLEEEYYEYHDDLEALLYNFVLQHPDELSGQKPV
jgi:hypothetical protein